MAYQRTKRNYRFINKNPVIDIMRTAIQDEGLMGDLDKAADLAGLTKATLEGWFHGDTRDPKHSSIMTTMIGLGYENTWKKARKLNIEEELEFARAWAKRERKKAEAARAKENPPKKRKRRAKKTAKRRAA